MPRAGSQVIFCDLPVRIDTYKGCSHDCKYCFVRAGFDLTKIGTDETVNSVRRFVEGKTTDETRWIDWPIPLHWGGTSDPFQPCEGIHRRSFDMLKMFAETKYPVVISTKGKYVAEPEYLELLKECNAVVQISLVSPKYDKLEQGAPPYAERLEMLAKLAPVVKRLIVRVQPYMLDVKNDVLKGLVEWKKRGVYGITIEGLKLKQKTKGMVKVASDQCYPVDRLEKDFREIRRVCKAHDMAFWVSENRLRNMGDDLCCCGIGGLEGFKGNTYNLNYYLYDKEKFVATEVMKQPGTGLCFKTFQQTTAACYVFQEKPFAELIEICAQDKAIIEGLTKQPVKSVKSDD